MHEKARKELLFLCFGSDKAMVHNAYIHYYFVRITRSIYLFPRIRASLYYSDIE